MDQNYRDAAVNVIPNTPKGGGAGGGTSHEGKMPKCKGQMVHLRHMFDNKLGR